MVTGDSQEEVMIFRYKQTLHHNIYIIIIIIVVTLIAQLEPITAMFSPVQPNAAITAIQKPHSSCYSIVI